jgi:hypothetical protein
MNNMFKLLMIMFAMSAPSLLFANDYYISLQGSDSETLVSEKGSNFEELRGKNMRKWLFNDLIGRLMHNPPCPYPVLKAIGAYST